MPGVVVYTAVRSGPQTDGETVSGQAFMVGTTVRGKSTEPTLLRNLTEYSKYYGGYVSGNLYAHAQTYFEEGGSRLHIQRVVADDAVAGSVTIANSAGSTVATFTAADVGAWSANLDVQVVAGDVSGKGLFEGIDHPTLHMGFASPGGPHQHLPPSHGYSPSELVTRHRRLMAELLNLVPATA